MTLSTSEIIWEGTPISRGIGIGPSFLLPTIEKGMDLPKSLHNPEGEIERYQEAVKNAIHEIYLLQEQLKKEQAFDGIAVLETHLELLHDPILTSHIEAEIKRTRSNSLSVLQQILSSYEKKFEMLEDPFFQERFKDIQDVAERVMKHLDQKNRHRLETVPKGVVLFARDLTPSEVASILPGTIVGLVTERGGATSHTAIIAKAKGIPYVSHLNFQLKYLKEGLEAIVDGANGSVILSPLEETLAKYQNEIERLKRDRKYFEKYFEPPTTLDGHEIQLSLNIDTIDDLPAYPAPSPCGLFRTEFLLGNEGELPTEEEQFEIYKEILQRFKNQSVVIRAFDLGGDKGAIVKEHLGEENPALGLRAIRLLLREMSIFKKQIRALLRASSFGQLKFLIPMVTSYEEVLKTKQLIRDLEAELKQEGQSFSPFAAIGCMIEVPSAALILDSLTKECDFFSIGTNDLLQFILAVDRNRPDVVEGCSPFHPAMIRILQTIIQKSNKASLPVSICGEIASNPRTIPLLIGLGLKELSLGWSHVSTIRETIAKVDTRKAKELVEFSLTLNSTKEIEALWASAF